MLLTHMNEFIDARLLKLEDLHVDLLLKKLIKNNQVLLAIKDKVDQEYDIF